jgi:ribosomal protein L33
MNKPKKYKIEFSKEASKKLDDLPDDAYEELTKIVTGFKTGKLNPEKVGQPIDWVELDTKLECPECKSNNVEWLLDKNSKEVTFHCIHCSESFWMTQIEYKNAVKRNPDKIIP